MFGMTGNGFDLHASGEQVIEVSSEVVLTKVSDRKIGHDVDTNYTFYQRSLSKLLPLSYFILHSLTVLQK